MCPVVRDVAVLDRRHDVEHLEIGDLTLDASLRRLVRAAIRHQLARPGLARVLDFEEQRLVLDESDRLATGSITAEVAAVLRAHRRRLRIADSAEAAFDLVTIARALIDGAMTRGQVVPAAMGYLKTG